MYIVKYHANHVFFARVAMIHESGVIVVERSEEFSDALFLFFVGEALGSFEFHRLFKSMYYSSDLPLF